MKNKRYWLFGSEDHYPRGGFRDFIMSGDNVQECKSHIASLLYLDPLYNYSLDKKEFSDGRYDIVDTESMKVIYSLDAGWDGLEELKESEE